MSTGSPVPTIIEPPPTNGSGSRTAHPVPRDAHPASAAFSSPGGLWRRTVGLETADLPSIASTFAGLDGRGQRDGRIIVPYGFPAWNQIKPSEVLLTHNPQAQRLATGWPLPTAQDLKDLAGMYGGKPVSVTGIGDAMPAAPRSTHADPVRDYHRHTWLRDTFYHLFFLALQGDWKKVENVLAYQFAVLAGPEQRDIMYGLSVPTGGGHYHYNAVCDERRPVVRLGIQGGKPVLHADMGGGRVSHASHWGNNQPGSFAQVLYAALRFATAYPDCPFSDLNQFNETITRAMLGLYGNAGNPYAEHNKTHSILALTIEFLENVTRNPASNQFELWSLGFWEERKLMNRQTDLVPIRAMASAAWHYLEARRWKGFPIADVDRMKRSLDWLMTGAGREIDKLVNPHSRTDLAAEAFVEVEEGGQRRFVPYIDSSTAFCNWPYNPEDSGLNRNQVEANERSLYHLMEPDAFRGHGIIRYRGDPFCHRYMNVLADGDYNVSPEHLVAGGECQWFIADPVEALTSARIAHLEILQGRYGSGLERACRAWAHLARSYAQVPAAAESYAVRKPDGRDHIVKVRPGDPHEGMVLMQGRHGRPDFWAFTPNTLNWTGVLRALATARMMVLQEQLPRAEEALRAVPHGIEMALGLHE